MPGSRRLPSAIRESAPQLTVVVDGTAVTCTEGETIATVLLAEGSSAFYHAVDGAPRLPFCNMGTCYECTVTVDGRPLQRACVAPVEPGMQIVTGDPR